MHFSGNYNPLEINPIFELEFPKKFVSRWYQNTILFINILYLSTRIINTSKQYFYFDTITHSLFYLNQSSHLTINSWSILGTCLNNIIIFY